MNDQQRQSVDVDGIIAADGYVQVRRVRLDDWWQPVEQGRQGEDEYGRFVLVMVSGGPVQQLRLDRETLRWYLVPLAGDARQDIV
ncbi:MAG: hypothetical protein R3C44_19910 [Chloroflexota bacterium]